MNERAAKASEDSWNDRRKPRSRGGDSEHSFHSAKLIDGYQDFVVAMQKMLAKNAMEEANNANAAENPGHISQRKKMKRSKKRRSKSHKDSESRASRRATSVSSASSAPLSATYDQDLRRLRPAGEQQDDAAEFDLNISFSGGYVPNTDLGRVDKGQGNPQFAGVDVC